MKSFYANYLEQLRQNGEADRRLLRKLRIAFAIWMVSSLTALLWITLTA